MADRYTLQAGRTIARDGRPLVRLDRVPIPEGEAEGGCSGMFHADPTEADDLARRVVALLNGDSALVSAARVALDALRNSEPRMIPDAAPAMIEAARARRDKAAADLFGALAPYEGV